MSPKHFFAGLAITSLTQLCIAWLFVLFMDSMKDHLPFICITILAMVLFSAMLFGAAKISVRHPPARLFIQLIMIAVFLKLLVCLALVIGYKRVFDPNDHHFIWPFLVVYISSTIYEVVFLEKVGREKQKSKA